MKVEYKKVTIEGEAYKIKSHHKWAAFDGDSCLWSFIQVPAYDKGLNMWLSDTEADLVASSTRRVSGLYKIIEQPNGSYAAKRISA